MKSKKYLKKLLSIILTITIILTGYGVSTLASTVQVSASSKITTEREKEDKKITEITEIKSQRTEKSNTYLMSDGSRKLEIYSEDIRYKKDGEWIDYDASLVDLKREDKKKINKFGKDPSKYKNVNNQGDVKHYFPKEMQEETPVITSYNEYGVSFSADFVNGQVQKESDETLRYSDNDSEIIAEYISLKNGIKENIILNEKPEINEFKFTLDLEGLTYKINKKTGVIKLKDKDTGKKKAIIQAPNIMDGEGNISYKDVWYEANNRGDGSIELVIKIAEEYFNEDTKYPVTIDPVVTWSGSGMDAAIVSSAIFLQNVNMYSAHQNLKVFDSADDYGPYQTAKYYVYLSTSMLDEVVVSENQQGLYDTYIESATLSLTEVGTASKPGTILIKAPASSWDPTTITWSNQPDINDTEWASFTCTGDSGETYITDITEWARSVASEEIQNTGLVLMQKNPKASDNFYGCTEKTITDSSGETRSVHPCISIIYKTFEKYDGSLYISAEYDDETEKINVELEEYETPTNTIIMGYKLFERKNNAEKFECIDTTTDITNGIQVDTENTDITDLRLCIEYSDGTLKPSNIVTLEKYEEEVEETTELPDLEIPEGSEEETTIIEDLEVGARGNIVEITTASNLVTKTYFEQTTSDTDGDGLDDGYEIWDFKSKWNEEVEENGVSVYVADSDGDGFPDDYEVFVLGSDPSNPTENVDSDEDGVYDKTEMTNGTDPWLKDSDFDNNPDDTDGYPRQTTGGVDRQITSTADIHIGKYDIEITTEENGVIISEIVNLYGGKSKKITNTYSDGTESKTQLNYYNYNDGKVMATIEYYNNDKSNNICTTYCYDNKGNMTYVCSQNSQYIIEYNEEGGVKSFKAGDYELVNNKETVQYLLEENSEETIQIGDVVKKTKNEIIYGGVTELTYYVTEYKVDSENESSTARVEEMYFGTNTEISYKLEYNINDDLIKLIDYTQDKENPDVYTYLILEDGTEQISRNDDFQILTLSTVNEDEEITTTKKNYKLKNLKGNNVTYEEVIESNSGIEGIITTEVTLHNNDKIFINDNYNEETILTSIYSDVLQENIISYNVKETIEKTEYDITIGTLNTSYKNYYNQDGNLVKVVKDDITEVEYDYDGHNRLVSEKNYKNGVEFVYSYTKSGNINASTKYAIDSIGTRLEEVEKNTYTYNNNNWPDLLTEYNNKVLEYDEAKNPKTYINGISMTWTRARLLNSYTDAQNNITYYTYNDEDNRKTKENANIYVEYEWDNTKLIKERVKEKNAEKTYDIYYLYDDSQEIIGFECSYVNDTQDIMKEYVYFEKNDQGDVVGLIDVQGIRFATYSYDSWGNVLNTQCNSGYEKLYNLNNIKYRGYYMDDESNLYYLKNRYYDPYLHRFLNSDTVDNFGVSESAFSYNLFVYCDNDPVNNADKNGDWYYSLKKLNKRIEHLKKKNKNYKKLEKIYNYSKNNYDRNVKKLKNYRKQNGGKGKAVVKGYIYNQTRRPWKILKYGKSTYTESFTIDSGGCVPVAYYNLLKFLGEQKSIADVISEFEINQLNNGPATKTNALDKILDAHNITFKKYKNSEKLNNKYSKGKCMIFIAQEYNVSSGYLSSATHAMFIEIQDDEIIVYNEGNRKSNNKRTYKTYNEFLETTRKVSYTNPNTGKKYEVELKYVLKKAYLIK